MWRTFGASVVGLSHQASSTPCQDAYAIWKLSPDEILVAVADGAGSASQAARAARLAVDEAIGYCRSAFESAVEIDDWPAVLNAALAAARTLLVATAEIENIESREFASTLQVMIASREACAMARVGDGGGVMHAAGRVSALGDKPDNQYVNETDFLTSASLRSHTTFSRIAIDGVAIFTDGLQPVAMRLVDWEPHEPFFMPILSFARSVFSETDGSAALSRLLAQPSFDSRTDDDRTLVVAVWTDD